MEKPRSGEAGPQWEDEIAERVARYRRLRGRAVRPREDPNLEFDFKAHGGDDEDNEDPAGTREDALDLVLGNAQRSNSDSPLLDSVFIEHRGTEGLRAEDAAEWALEPRDLRAASHGRAEPVEIVLQHALEEDDGETEEVSSRPPRLAAPVGLRFAAGLMDAAVLLAAAGVFALVFLKSGGRLSFSRHAPDWVAIAFLGFAVAVFMVLYIGLFTAWAFASPGQAAMDLRVRTLDDQPPDWPASRRRALSYLVSAAALMLGFVWAIFDPDGLAWHDRMSGTCLVRRSREK